MLQRQRGISLILVALLMAGLAALAMAALFSWRYERNLFAEGLARLSGQHPAAVPVANAATGSATVPAPPSAPGNPLRRCIIDGKTVFSDTECSSANATTKNVVVHEIKGIDAPRAPKPEPADAAAHDIRAKMIEKATR